MRAKVGGTHTAGILRNLPSIKTNKADWVLDLMPTLPDNKLHARRSPFILGSPFSSLHALLQDRHCSVPPESRMPYSVPFPREQTLAQVTLNDDE